MAALSRLADRRASFVVPAPAFAGSYWTGLVFADGKRWPEERTTWTGAAMILAADALSDTTVGGGIFRATGLPMGDQLLGGFPGGKAWFPSWV